MTPSYPLVLEPEAFSLPAADGVLIVDLCKAESYAQGHLPGAVHLDYAELTVSRPPAGGLLPDDGALSRVLSGIGLAPHRHVVAYDDEGGGKASRLLWTLDVLGHQRLSLLNGGRRAWSEAGLPLDADPVRAEPSSFQASAGDAGRADRDYILTRLGAADFALVDARTPEEYSGQNRRAERGGHIPGAVNYNWVNAMDQARALRLKPRQDLLQEFAALGVTADKEVVAYCHTHHRSSHTYIVLKSLGFTRLRGYPGSWSEWGNDPSTPVAV
ncbi:MAG: rhodanese-like domain-containing protein [Gammaproteobacteria bacterium]|nr:rhodanese-like domain-containing protein [Gammaproteobacteria bacterium]